MKETVINIRLTIRAAQLGLIRLLLPLILATASLPVLSANNLAPVISGTPPTSVIVGNTYNFQPSATDANGNRLKFSISNKPAWANFSSQTGQLQGTPGSSSVGTYSNIVISVSDRRTSASLPAFSIRVDAPVSANTAPVIGGTPATSVMAGSTYSFQPTATDADGDSLTFSITNKPSWASFSSSTGQLSGTPATSGSYSNIVISVSDGQASASLAAFTIAVQAANDPPTISGTPATSGVAGSTYSFQPAATDADGDSLTFSITNKPSWASFSSSTGQLSGTPATSGSYSNIVISVSDGQASANLPAFSIDVLSSTSGNLALGKPVVASSVDSPDDQASYAVDGDTSSRWSSWYSDPQWIYVDLGATYAIDQVVLNWHEAAYGSGYDIQVSDDAQNWVTVFAESNGDGGIDDISFAPVSARYVRLLGLQRGTGWGYSLWEFEVYGASTTAQSSGTTSSGTSSSGTTSGSTTTSGTTAVQTGSLTLQWTAPVTRADGTPLSLSDIDGYHIYYGTSAGNYLNSVDVPDGTAQSAIVADIPPGTYYVVMTTYDVYGLESSYSSAVTKNAQ
jgi:hypothetical protein